jgi:ABC-2 type transport system permease protein
MKLWEIFRFEIAYQARRVTTWLCFVVLLLFAFWIVGASTPTDAAVFQNAPFEIAFVTVLGGVVWLLTAASIAGEAAARDVQTRIHPLMYTAPVSKAEYLGGRFLAAFALNGLLLLAVPAGLLLALLTPAGAVAPLAPLRPAAYITAYGLIALPVAFVATAIQFAFAALSRRPMASYLASVLLLISSTFIMDALTDISGWPELENVLDLVGIVSIVNNLADMWTAIDKNTRLVGLEPTLIVNRLLWLAVAGGVLAFTYHRFRFAHPAEGHPRAGPRRRLIRRRRTPSPTLPVGSDRPSSISIPQVRQSFGFTTAVRQTLTVAWTSFRMIAKRGSGLILLTAIAALVVVALPEEIELFGVPLLPRTGYVLTFLTASLTNPVTPWSIIPMLIVLYAGELIWQEREAGLAEITDVAPVSEWSLLLGKFFGLILILVVWLALLMVAGMLVQVTMGYGDLEVGVYVHVLLGRQLPEYLLVAALALTVHAVVNQKYVGHMVAILALGFIGFAARLGIEHHLLVYGSSPAWSYSDMSGFGPPAGPWLWFKLYWAAWALLLMVGARLLWVRGRAPGLRSRLRLARSRFTPPTIWATAVAVGLVIALGGFVFYNTNVLNEYRSAADWVDKAAEYERRYGQYEGIPQPRLTGTDLHVEIYPARQAADIRGTYRLVNSSAVPIKTIHVATVPDVETRAITFNQVAVRVLADADLGHQIYDLAEPLQPGATLQLTFEVHIEPRGFQNSEADAAIVANGTFFTNQDWLPAIGYQSRRELSGAMDRSAHGLAPQPFFRSLSDAEASQDLTGEEQIAFTAVVGTDADQIAVAPGALRRAWTEGGRRYFHYAADSPIWNEYAFFSAHYALREARWNDVTIQIYHHPAHTANLDRMLQSVQAALDYYSAQFGPYPYRHLSLVEHPGVGGMHAYASLITFQEGFSLFNPAGNPRGPDIPFALVAHEVAHQWWGSYLAPIRVEGNGILSESLAEYAAFQVVKKTYGQEHLRRYMTQLRRQYAGAGARAALPLLRANGDFQQYYGGPVALYTVSEYIGEDQVNRALRRLIEAHRSGSLLTALDLYRELQAVTPHELQYLLHDLFEANTVWELETEQAVAEQTSAGTWQLTLDVRARKVVVDPTGAETEVPMNDLIEIGVFASGQGGAEVGEPLYTQVHSIRSGAQRITVTVPARPALAGIDSHYLLRDLNLGNNLADVQIEN